MTPDRFTPYSCSFSGKVPRELWMDYDEEEAIDSEDDDSSSDPQPEDTESSADKGVARFERRVLTRLMAVLTGHELLNLETLRDGQALC